MNKSLFAFLTFTAVSYGVFSEAKAEDIIRYGAVTNEIKQVELKKEDDVFDSSADIKPLTVRMSESERQQENSSDLDYIEEDFQICLAILKTLNNKLKTLFSIVCKKKVLDRLFKSVSVF